MMDKNIDIEIKKILK